MNANNKVALIDMPFGAPLVPSISLSLLNGVLSREGIPVKTFYFKLKLMEKIGIDIYDLIFSGGYLSISALSYMFATPLDKPLEINPSDKYLPDNVGEWIFNGSLFLDGVNDEYYSSIPGELLATIRNIRNNTVSEFLYECVQTIYEYDPKIVGFSSTFQQHVASLALAKMVKEKRPDIYIVFGGPNCEGVMGVETIRQFPFVDVVISGKGEIVFCEVVRGIFKAGNIPELAGVYKKDNITYDNSHYSNAVRVGNLDTLPIPDFDDFFYQLKETQLELSKHYQPALPFETSRGCWWGENQQCSFCGLNGSQLVYQCKTPQHALKELDYLSQKYPNIPVLVVDNVIDKKYFVEFVPLLEKLGLNLRIYCAIRINLQKEDLRRFRNTGITMIQPGIESLNSNVLRLINKGTTYLHAIQLLKWCKEFGIRPLWNIIWGFPGEKPEDYSEMSKLIPLIYHLHPPLKAGRFTLQRHSPFFEYAQEYGLINIRPHFSYYHIYPLDDNSVFNLSHHFTFSYHTFQDVSEYTNPIVEQVENWKRLHAYCDLFAADNGDVLCIQDTRPTISNRSQTITGIARVIYLSCDQIRTLGYLQKLTYKKISLFQLEKQLTSFLEQGIMVRDGDRFLSLAVSRKQ